MRRLALLVATLAAPIFLEGCDGTPVSPERSSSPSFLRHPVSGPPTQGDCEEYRDELVPLTRGNINKNPQECEDVPIT